MTDEPDEPLVFDAAALRAAPPSLIAARRAARLLDYLGEALPDDPAEVYVEAGLSLKDLWPTIDDAEGGQVLRAVYEITKQWPAKHRPTAEAVVMEDELLTHPDRSIARGSIAMSDYPGWLRRAVLDALAAWTSGNARTCTHGAANLDGEAPVLTAAWRPGLVCCQACKHLLQRPVRLCQACGADDADGPLLGSWIGFGRLLVFCLTCPAHVLVPCAADEPGRPEESSDA